MEFSLYILKWLLIILSIMGLLWIFWRQYFDNSDDEKDIDQKRRGSDFFFGIGLNFSARERIKNDKDAYPQPPGCLGFMVLLLLLMLGVCSQLPRHTHNTSEQTKIHP